MKAKIIIPIIIVIAVLGGVFFLLNPASGPPAKLIVNSGAVEVKASEQWQKASSGMELKQGFSVRTLEGASATILFFDSSAMRLDENTEITLTNLNPSEEDTQVGVDQNSGRTWNRVLLLSGIEDYEVDTPNAVASVRGTGFSVASGQATEIWASDGHLVVGREENGSWVELADVGAEESMRISERMEKDAVAADEWTRQNIAEDENHYLQVKQHLRDKYGFLIMLAKTQGLAEENVDSYLEEYVRGRMTAKDAAERGWISAEQAKLLPLEFRRERPAIRTAGQEAERRGFAYDEARGTYVSPGEASAAGNALSGLRAQINVSE